MEEYVADREWNPRALLGAECSIPTILCNRITYNLLDHIVGLQWILDIN